MSFIEAFTSVPINVTFTHICEALKIVAPIGAIISLVFAITND